ncbi:hypothetical protein F7725_005208 [Dissostichus mawsoni]|uniref:Reverse transcriptase domain-containing protein n=1 Tax=Dissostichus mawsoni TaxID=36200 RepID=A0A7J5YRR9_DISMA|nr:hypothetical protein F7725_005208 [Dissostichus mawsoni]
MLYSDIYSSVSLNPGMSPRFKVVRGIRQGCPISPKLFILTTQVLTTLIIKIHKILGITLFDKEFKICQFADDTSIFLKNKSMVNETLNTIRLSLNLSKCELLPIHSCDDSTIDSIRVVPEVKYLGITFSKNYIRREDLNICNRITDMKKSLSQGISKLIYPCHSCFVSSANIKKANSIIFHFLWKNKTHYIKKSQLVKEYEKGGIKALDFESMIGTIKIKWLKAFLSQPESMWFHIPKAIFKRLGGFDFLLKCDCEILNYWKIVFSHNFSPHGSTLWNNRVIIINRKSLFRSDWHEKGILFVNDLLDCNDTTVRVQQQTAAMHVNDLLKWNKRMAIVYATGIWTMVGSYAFYKYTGRLEDLPVKKEEVPLPEDTTQLLFITEHSKAVLVYQKDFVPYTTRIYNFISSFNNPGRDE